MERQVYPIFKKGGHGGILSCHWITASCILHNTYQIQNNVFLPQWQIDNEAVEDPMVFADDDIATRDAKDICEALSEYFMS